MDDDAILHEEPFCIHLLVKFNTIYTYHLMGEWVMGFSRKGSYFPPRGNP
jgi:hypothetical protein